MIKCTIERVSNGFIFREVNDENGKEEGNIIIFEDGDPVEKNSTIVSTCFEEEIIPLKKLFLLLMGKFGVYNEQREKKALDVSIIDRYFYPLEDSLKELEELREKIIVLKREKNDILLEEIKKLKDSDNDNK